MFILIRVPIHNNLLHFYTMVNFGKKNCRIMRCCVCCYTGGDEQVRAGPPNALYKAVKESTICEEKVETFKNFFGFFLGENCIAGNVTIQQI